MDVQDHHPEVQDVMDIVHSRHDEGIGRDGKTQGVFDPSTCGMSVEGRSAN